MRRNVTDRPQIECLFSVWARNAYTTPGGTTLLNAFPVQVAAGLSHTLFVCGSGRVFAAGSCDLGQFQAASGMAASYNPSAGERRSVRATPMRISLPFLDGPTAAGKGVILHEAKAGGNASVFLIRAPDDPVRPLSSLKLPQVLCGPHAASVQHAYQKVAHL